jgi:biopolymer transport protein ExbD
MSKNKLMLFRLRRKKDKKVELELTSLIDIVVILLVFLIQTSVISKLDLTVRENIELPDSNSIDGANRGITIQVDRNLQVYVEDQKLELSPGVLWTNSNADIIKSKIQGLKASLEEVIKKSENTERLDLVMNLVMDKELDYLHIQNFMSLAVSVGIQQFKFIVLEQGGNF